MTMGMQALSGLGLVYIILIFCRCILKWGDGSCGTDKRPGIGIAQTTGSRQVQADVAQIWDSSAGLMAVIADGIGSANTGKVCAQVAADAILDRYEPYCELNDPVYFFRTSFLEANQRIQSTIGERRGGASTGAVRYNAFKSQQSGRNSILLPLKNEPLLMLILNFLPLALGYLLKCYKFHKQGFGEAWDKGMHEAFALLKEGRLGKRPFRLKDLPNYILMELWMIWNMVPYLWYRLVVVRFDLK